MPKEEHVDCKNYGKFEVIMDEKDQEQEFEDRSSGYDSQLRIPQMNIDPPTPTLPDALKSESLPMLPPLVHNANRMSADYTHTAMTHPSPLPIPKHLRPQSVSSVRSLDGSRFSINSVLSRQAGPSTLTLPTIQEGGDGKRCTVRTAGIFELQRELSPSVFSLVRRRLDLKVPKQTSSLVPKQISASKYGGSIGCISVPGDAPPMSYDEAVANMEQHEKEVMVGNVSTV